MWTTIIIVVALSVYIADAQKILCEFSETINVSGGYSDVFGNFHYNQDIYKPEMFGEFNYTLIVTMNETIKVPTENHFRACVCKLRPCVRLCCNETMPCFENDKFPLTLSDGTKIQTNLFDGQFGILKTGRPCMPMFPYDEDEWNLFQNGSMKLFEEWKPIHTYCIHANSKVLACNVPEDVVDLKGAHLKVLGMIISLPFLFITFCVYASFAELRNLHGKTLLCYVFSLATLYVSWIVINLANLFAGTFACIFVAYAAYISVMMCFFWLNIMCYDIFSTFRAGIRTRGSDQKRFIKYSIYAFGMSILLTTVVAIINSLPIPEDLRPKMAYETCFVADDLWIQLLYVYLPISIIMIVNVILYGITAYTIYKVKKETAIVRTGDSKRHSNADKDRFVLYLRLFIIMGASWAMEPISWIFTENNWAFIVTDILNCLQGLIIFLFFVWKPNIRALIVKRYRKCRYFPENSSEPSGESAPTDETKLTTVTPSAANKLIVNNP